MSALGGINLHEVVRGAITTLHPDIPCTIYHSNGNVPDASGMLNPSYQAGFTAKAQIQSIGTDKLYHSGHTGQEEDFRAFYISCPRDLATRLAGIFRPLARGGDMIQLDDKTWWLVDAIIEDFTASGWINVRVVWQSELPLDWVIPLG